MPEDLYADSREIAGLGKLADQIGLETLASHKYINEHAVLGATTQGQILQRLVPFVEHYQEHTRSRQVHLAANCSYIGDELKKAAWLYHDQEKENYDAFNAHTELDPHPQRHPGTSDTPATGTVDAYDHSVDYGIPSGISYPPPAPAVDDTREAIDEAASWLGEIDHIIFENTGWSPLNEATIPITGSWNEIRRLGEAFEIAGNAMEAAGDALQAGAVRVDQHWNGLAAQAFSDYSGKQIAGMRWEGPCGRTVGELSKAITDKLREAVQTVVGKIVEMLEAEVDISSGRDALKVALKKVPVFGTAWQTARIIEIIDDARQLTMDLIREIEAVVDAFGQLLDAISDPEGQINRTIDQYLAPLNELIDTAQKTGDAVLTADITPVIDTPHERFSVGEGTAPWQDA